MGLLLYNCFLLIYGIGIRMASLWNPKARLWLKGREGLFEKLQSAIDAANVASQQTISGTESQNLKPETRNSKLVWMHCASLGEFEQGRPVLEKIKEHYPNYRILLTFFSPSGYEVRKNYEGADVVCYLPMDSAAAARRFLDIIKPSLVLWVKYDYWYYFLTEIHKRRLPLLLISGVFRDDQPFFKWYGGLHRNMLHCFTHLFVQNTDSQRRLSRSGLPEKVTVSGDTRFDRVVEIAEKWEPVPLVEAFCTGYPVIVAGSTWPEDEEELDHYANTHPEFRFIIAPHEIGAEHLRDIERLFKKSVRYSRWSATDDRQPNVLIIDNIGMLSRLYKYATVAYIGGGFGDDGVHNVLEAAVYGKPVIYGPAFEKYQEAVDLIVTGGAFSVSSGLELEKLLDGLFRDTVSCNEAGRKAGHYVLSQQGATKAILNYIQEKRLLTN